MSRENVCEFCALHTDDESWCPNEKTRVGECPRWRKVFHDGWDDTQHHDLEDLAVPV